MWPLFTSSSREGWRGPEVGQGSRPLPAESEMEEGGEEEGSERKGAAAARTSQVRLGFRLAERRPGRPHFLCQFLLSTGKK